jgi:hypothetical protein
MEAVRRRFLQAETGGTPAIVRALRPEGPRKLSLGRRRCALARPGQRLV